MGDVSRLWRLLADPTIPSGVRQDWKEWLGDEYRPFESFLLPEKEDATRYPCPEPQGEGCPRRIVKHASDRYVAVCGCVPRQCEDVPLGSDDVVLYSLKMEALLRALASGLGLESIDPQPLQGIPGAWRLGEAVVGEERTLVVFLRPDRDDGYGTAMLSACSVEPSIRTVFVLPSGPVLSEVARSVLGRLGAGWLVAPEVLDWKTLRFAARMELPFEHVNWSGAAATDGPVVLAGENEPVAVIFTAGTSGAQFVRSAADLDTFWCQRRDAEHVVDAIAAKPTAGRMVEGTRRRRNLTTAEASVLLAYLILHAERPSEHVRPGNLPLPRLKTADSRKKTFDNMRGKVDIRKDSTQEYRLFSQQRPWETGSSAFAFAPAADVSYAFAFRFQDYQTVRGALAKNPVLKIH